MLNLLSNAIKYNRPNGSVTIACDAEAPQHGATLGDRHRSRHQPRPARIGSSPRSTDSTPRPRASRGPVSGLALSKGLMEAIGGTLGVDSEVGRGSTFWIELPNVEEPEVTIGARKQPPLALRRRQSAESTVLYIEDDVANVQLVERLLLQRPNIKLDHVTAGRCGRRTGPAVPAGPHPARRPPHRHPRLRSARTPPGRFADRRHPGRRTLGRRHDVAASAIPQRRRLRLPLQAARTSNSCSTSSTSTSAPAPRPRCIANALEAITTS